jgi:hypothetical protein
MEVPMETELPPEDRQLLRELLAWDDGRRRADERFAWLALVAGAALLVYGLVSALGASSDREVVGILVTGVAGGLFLVVLHLVLRARVRDRHRIALLLRRLTRRP